MQLPMYTELLLIVFLDMLLSFEGIDFLASRDVSCHKFSLPKSRESFAVSLEKLNLPGSIAESNIRLGESLQVAETLRQLLDAVAFPLPFDSLPKTGSADLRRNLGWALNCYQRHWKVMLEWTACTESPTEGIHPATSLSLEFLASIRKCYTCSSRFGPGTSLDQQAICIWLQCGAEMLASSKLHSVPEIQQVLSQQLNEAVQIAQGFPDVATFIEDAFLPLLIDISKNESLFQSFDLSLQVSTLAVLPHLR